METTKYYLCFCAQSTFLGEILSHVPTYLEKGLNLIVQGHFCGEYRWVAKYYIRCCVSYFYSNDAHRYSCVISFSPGFQIICYSFAGFRKCSWDILGRTRLDETYTQESTHIKKQTKVNALESKISCFCGLSPVRIVSDSPKGLNLLAELLQDISEILSTCWDTWLTDGPLLNWKSSEMRRWMKADRRWIGFE